MDKRKLSIAIVSILLMVVVGSILYTYRVVREITSEEQKKIQEWAAVEEEMINTDDMVKADSLLNIVKQNKTIPAYIVDSKGNMLSQVNGDSILPKLSELHGPIRIQMPEDSGLEDQYIYYDDSQKLKRLKILPYILFTLLSIFVLVGVLIIYSEERSEQNRVWVGLSKETAHQLGTPISSLNAWVELLQARYPQDELIPQMRPDIERLQTIAERFSKIGSAAELQLCSPAVLIQQSVDYMQKRISGRIVIRHDIDSMVKESKVLMNTSLMSWVLENLIKNAVDAMNGVGEIVLREYKDNQNIIIEVQDNGKGIERKKQSQIFRPGFTTKQRGWGLGLSLAKRIVEDYHRGKLVLKSSEIGVGTTFLISLKEAE